MASLDGDDSAFELIIEIHAPKIIVPENSSSDAGFLLLDTGHLVVRGVLGATGMTWEISLKDINAGMPLRVRDFQTFGQQSLYLIKVRVHTFLCVCVCMLHV